MKTKNESYISPKVDVLEVQIEKGFAISDLGTNSFDPGEIIEGDTDNWQTQKFWNSYEQF